MIEMATETLPPSWTAVELQQTCVVIQGQSPPGSTYNADAVGLPFLQGKAEFGDIYPEAVKWCSAPSKIAEPSDVLISVRAPVGPTNLCGVRSCIGRGLAAIRPDGGIPSKYILYGIRASDDDLRAKATGTTFEAIKGDDLRYHTIPLAPLPEQRRIVAEIEKQFTRLDASVAALRRTQANLKRYRASVLRAACSGELVPTEAELARAEGREYESADVLLERILAERRARWESQEKRRGKYKEPSAPNTSDLPPLPDGWTWATVDQMIVRSEYGTSVKCSYEGDGIPVLRIPNIVGGEIDLTDLKFANQSLPVDDDRALQVGDVLMCRTNGSISLIGKTAVIKRHLEPHHSFASYLLRFRFVNFPPLSNWFHLFAASQLGRNYIEREAASSAGQHNVSLSLIHRMAVPVPPLAEQHRIVAEVERRLSVIQQAETAVEASVQRAERLRQSILKRAFAGELVPQDPRDEPASVLLERIRAQREAEQAVSATKKRPARRRRATPKAQQLTLEEASA